MASVMVVMKQNNARKAERALKEILDKADGNANGRVELKDFMEILEANGVEIDDSELASFSALSDETGEISKNDLLIHTKNSSFWKGFMESKARPCSHTSKVEAMNTCDRSSKAETAFRLFDMNKDGYITRDEFKKVSKKLDSSQIEAVFHRFDLNKDGRLSMEEFKRLMEKR